MTWYEVFSPEIRHSYGPWEPVEFTCCYVAVEAENKRAAKILAIQHPDMWEWVCNARSDNQNPFTQLKVDEALCEHGVCYITTTCAACKAEWDLEEKEWT